MADGRLPEAQFFGQATHEHPAVGCSENTSQDVSARRVRDEPEFPRCLRDITHR
jgi:hypothetical protein